MIPELVSATAMNRYLLKLESAKAKRATSSVAPHSLRRASAFGLEI